MAQSIGYNPGVGITGGLVRAKGWFAQLLEGSTETVTTLMQSIERDPRHSDVTVSRVIAQGKRRLGRWSMAYDGEWQYVARNISEVFEQGMDVEKQRIDRLENMIVASA